MPLHQSCTIFLLTLFSFITQSNAIEVEDCRVILENEGSSRKRFTTVQKCLKGSCKNGTCTCTSCKCYGLFYCTCNRGGGGCSSTCVTEPSGTECDGGSTDGEVAAPWFMVIFLVLSLAAVPSFALCSTKYVAWRKQSRNKTRKRNLQKRLEKMKLGENMESAVDHSKDEENVRRAYGRGLTDVYDGTN